MIGMLVGIVLGVGAVTGPPSHAAATDSVPRTRVVMLGTGTPAPNPDRWGPATAVIVDGRAYIFDAGVGVVRQFVAARRKLGEAVEWSGIAFITHLHSDHTLGYPDLLLTPWTIGWQTAPARVFGPAGLQAMTDHVLATWSEDIRIRIGPGGESEGGAPPAVEVREVTPGVVYRDSLIEVSAFAVHHGRWSSAFGYRIETPDRTIVISGDAAPPSEIAAQCAGCDILIHEGGRPSAEAGRYYRDFHTTAEELAEVAVAARPELLVLYHQSGNPARTLEIVRARFDGPVVVASDLDVFPPG